MVRTSAVLHDAEILGLHLRRGLPSLLRVHGWINTGRAGSDGAVLLDRHAVVTFMLEGVLDLRLDGFSPQNVIGGLVMRRAPDRPDRRSLLAAPSPRDIEITLEPCYGIDGFIRARAVSISLERGKPPA